MVGLGRMGSDLVRHLLGKGHRVAGFDPVAPVRQELAKAGMLPADSLSSLFHLLRSEEGGGRARIWLSIPAGPPVDDVLLQLTPLLVKGDVVVDAGASRFTDTVRRSRLLAQSGLFLLDAGITIGTGDHLSLVVGGEKEPVDDLGPVFDALSSGAGYLHAGPVGSGHFVKMVGEGIESAFLQILGEGFDLMRHGPFDLDLAAISRIWAGGSVAGSRWLELLAHVFEGNPTLSSLRGYAESSDEVRWAGETAIEYKIFSPLLTLALMQGSASRQGEIFSTRLVAALRNASGGHPALLERGSSA